MNNLLDELAVRYSDRIIVFDSPPLLVTTESRVLATHMGQIVMVVESNKTTQAAVKQALSTIESCPVKLMLLNKAAHSGPVPMATAMVTAMVTATTRRRTRENPASGRSGGSPTPGAWRPSVPPGADGGIPGAGPAANVQGHAVRSFHRDDHRQRRLA
jgi:hypothetical protein